MTDNRRQAALALAGILGPGGVVVESDPGKPSLWERVRKPVLAATAALIAMQALPAAAAALALPGDSAIAAYTDRVNDDLSQGKGTWHGGKIGKITVAKADIEQKYAIDDGIPLPMSDRTCEVTYAPSSSVGLSYVGKYMTVKQSGLDGVEAMRGISHCMVKAFGDDEQREKTPSATTQAAIDVLTVLQSHRLGSDVFDGVLALEKASALTQMKFGQNAGIQKAGAHKLTALGLVDQYLSDPAHRADKLDSADSAKLVQIATAFARTSASAAAKVDLKAAAARGTDTVAALEAQGLKHAAKAAGDAIGSGLLEQRYFVADKCAAAEGKNNPSCKGMFETIRDVMSKEIVIRNGQKTFVLNTPARVEQAALAGPAAR